MSNVEEGNCVIGKVRRQKSKLTRKREALARRRAKAYFLRTYYSSNTKTLWAACRAVVIGSIVIVVGLAMTVIGYFDRDLTTTLIRNKTMGTTITVVDDTLRYKLKSMQYIGPIFMGVGMFLLIIACVITLESRDRHAQVIQDKSIEFRMSKRRQTIQSVTGDEIAAGVLDHSILNEKREEHERKRKKNNLNSDKDNALNFMYFNKIEKCHSERVLPIANSLNEINRAENSYSKDTKSVNLGQSEKIVVKAVVHSLNQESFITKNFSKKFSGKKEMRKESWKKQNSYDSGKHMRKSQSENQNLLICVDSERQSNILQEINRPRQLPRGRAPIARVESLVELSALNTSFYGFSPQGK